MKVEQAVREFKYNGMVLQDPDPAQSPEEIKAFYANIYPELNNAEIETETKGAKTVHEFRKAVGTKGVNLPAGIPHEAARRPGFKPDKDLRIESEMSDAEACRIGVARLQAAMLAKLTRKHKEGRSGWHKPNECDPIEIAQMLFDHLKKGDPVDVANFAMMLHNREGGGAALRFVWKALRDEIQQDMLALSLRNLRPEIDRLLRAEAKRG